MIDIGNTLLEIVQINFDSSCFKIMEVNVDYDGRLDSSCLDVVTAN